MNKKAIKNSFILIIIILTLVTVGLYIYARVLKKQLNEEIITTLSEVSQISKNSINNAVESEFNLIEDVAARLGAENGNGEFDIEKAVDTMCAVVEHYPFKRMGIVTHDSKSYSTDGAYDDEVMSHYFSKAFQGETMLTDTFIDVTDGKEIVVYAAPVKVNDEIVCLAFATFDIENFREIMSVKTFKGEGYSYIVKNNGDAVLSSNHPTSFKNMTNIFKSMNEAYGDNSQPTTLMSEKMRDGDSGYVIFNNEVDKYLYYTPLGINDWYLMNVVPESVVEARARVVMNMTYLLCLAVAGMTVAIVMHVVYSSKRRRDSLNKVLYVDKLTGGMSYSKFIIDAERSLAQNSDRNPVFMVLEIDNFKLLKELYGQDAADELIKYMYNAIEKFIPEDSLFARRVADKFVTIGYYTTREKLDKFLARFSAYVQNNHEIFGDIHLIRPKVGVYLVKDYTENIQRMQNSASIAMSSIANNNDEIVAYYDDFYKDTLLNNLQLEEQMEAAYENDEFVPYFQPKFDTVTQKIIGAEALVRWNKQDGSVVMPGQFIPLAESNGFVTKLDILTFEKVCKRQREIIDSGQTPVPISVNLSRRVMYKKDFIDDYVEIVRKYDIPVGLVELEITESTLFENQNDFRSIIDDLSAKGFKIIMDDFGVGYSSMMMLKSIPIDAMKLDKSFIDSYNDRKSRQIIISVIKIAGALDIAVTAEGDETQDQYEFLKLMDCTSIQGYYFATPLPFDEFREKLDESSGII